MSTVDERVLLKLLEGTLDLLIFGPQVFGAQHAQRIARAILQTSEDGLLVEHGALYPALQRLYSNSWFPLRQDVHFGLRMLAKSPGFAVVAILSVALAIGANTAIFSVVDAVLLRPLPFRDPARLVLVTEHFAFGPSTVISADFPAWK